MKKFLLSIFCCLMAVFAVQAEEYSYTFTAKQFSANGTKTLGDVDWILEGNGSYWGYDATKGQQFGSGNAPYTSLTLSTSGIQGTITKIILNTSGASNIKGEAQIKVGDVEFGDKITLTKTATDYTLTGSASGDIVISYTQTSSKAIYIKSITVTYTPDGGGEGGETPETPVDVAEPTFTPVDGTAFDESLDVTINVEDGLTAYYSKDGGNTYTEGTTVKITETTTITAYAQDAEGNKSDEVSAIYTKNVPVTPPAEGEVVDVLTRGTTGVTGTNYTAWSGKTATSSAVYAGQSAGGNDAIQLRSNNNNSGIVTTTSGGKATKVAVVWNSNTSSGRTLNVYGKNAPYSAATDLYSTSTQGTLLGTIEYGFSTELVIEGDYEYIGLRSAGSAMYLTSVSITWDESAGVTPVVPTSPVLPAETTFKGSMMVEITGIAADATVYYTTDESDPATSATRFEYTKPFEITATTTVKAVAVNEVGASELAMATYTLFVVEETAGYYMKVVAEPADWSGKYLIVYEDGADAYVFNGKDEVNGYVSATTDGDVINANSEIDAVAVTVAAMEGGYSISTVGGYMYRTAYENGMDFGNEAAVANTFAISEEGVVVSSVSGENKTTLRFNSASNQMRFRYYKSGQQPVQLYKYVEEVPMSHTLTVSGAGLATLYLGFNARIPSSVEAYTVTAVNEGWVSLTQVTGVLPSNQGVIIKAAAGDYKFYNEATATADVTGNLLEGSTYNRIIEGEAYVLGNVDGNVGLYKAELDENDGKAFLNNANKAYLVVPAASQAVQYFSFNFGAGTTGIEGVEAEGAVSGKIYDITGREVKAITTPGIYIVGGKKVVVK